jgi:hypothetical protein
MTCSDLDGRENGTLASSLKLPSDDSLFNQYGL